VLAGILPACTPSERVVQYVEEALIEKREGRLTLLPKVLENDVDTVDRVEADESVA
jgi:hypothetical protein